MALPAVASRSILAFLVFQCAPAASAAAQAPVRVACAGPATSLPVIDSARLMRDVAALADDSMEGRKVGTAAGARARAFVLAQFRVMGLDTLPRGALESFAAPGGRGNGANVIGLLQGRTRPGRIILVTAHYDHLGVQGGAIYNGADDNASGTAAMMAIAAWFHANPPQNTMMFVALDGEEEGLLGASALVRDHAVPIDSVLLNVNLDMVSRSVNRQLFAVGPARYPGLLPYLSAVACRARVTLMLGHDKGWSGSEDWTMESDQGVFYGAGIPFVYFGVEDHADYHKPTDDVSRIDPGFFAAATRAIALFVAQVDANPAAAASARGSTGKVKGPL
jgi:Zn-dependent M28 family amino/carboxypeptidase